MDCCAAMSAATVRRRFRMLRDRQSCVGAALDVTADANEPSESGFSPSLIVQEETVFGAQIELKWFLLVFGKL